MKKINKLHAFSGIVLVLFVGIHLFNHVWSIFGIQKHIEMMRVLRLFYRNPIIETLLLFAVITQIYTGFKLFFVVRENENFNVYQVFSGLYLAFFLAIHVSVVLVGRYIFKLDTNFYFGATGLNSFPSNLFFFPYYGLAILSFFVHLASIHYKKINKTVWGLSPKSQSVLIFIIGVLLAVLIFYGLTNSFKGIQIPEEYKVLNLS